MLFVVIGERTVSIITLSSSISTSHVMSAIKDIDQYYENTALKFVKEIDCVIKTDEEDKFAPKVVNESADFLLPENQLIVHFDPQPITSNVLSFSFKPGPLYLTTCYEEFSRNFIYVSVGKRIKNRLDLVPVDYEKIDDENVSPQTLLQCYSPGYDYWYSSFKKVPCSIGHVLSNKSAGDTHILMRVSKCQIKSGIEPIFGSICIYALLNDDVARLSETFYFDATPDPIKKKFRFFYGEPNARDDAIYPTSINIAEGSGSARAHFNSFLTSFPEELRLKDIYVVVQLNKFLTTDGDKAIAPYIMKGSSVSTGDKNTIAKQCERLKRFRQPIGFGIAKLFDDNGKLFVTPAKELSMPVFSQKVCLNDFQFGQLIKEMYPSDNTSPYYRYEQLEIEMKLSVYDLGGPDTMHEKLVEYGILEAPLSFSPSIRTLEPCYIETQVMSEHGQIVLRPEYACNDLTQKSSRKCIIHKVTPFIPAALPCGKSVTRQIKTTMENTMFLYPVQFDRFSSSHRNLCAKIELIEVSNSSAKQVPSGNTGYEVLSNIYNHSCITGPTFVSEAYTRVSYHVKNPFLSDEFKIRLPDILTARHWLKFTVYHVHVKAQNSRGSLLPNMYRPSNEKADQESHELGTGFLPLMLDGDNLLSDQEHIVLILPNEFKTSRFILEGRLSGEGAFYASLPAGMNNLSDIPSIRIRTRAFCSLVSQDKRVHDLLRNNPISLGYLPSSLMPVDVAARICYKACSLEPKETKLSIALQEMTKATPASLSQHFLVIFRVLIRAMLGGTCAYDQNYIDPFRHNSARSHAFLAMLKLFDKIFGDMGNSGVSNDTSKEREVLDVCVDYLLDEEVPVPEDVLKRIVSTYYIQTNEEFQSTTADLSSAGSSTIQPFSPSHLSQLMKQKGFMREIQANVDPEVNEIVSDAGDVPPQRPLSARSILIENLPEHIKGRVTPTSEDSIDEKDEIVEEEEECPGITAEEACSDGFVVDSVPADSTVLNDVNNDSKDSQFERERNFSGSSSHSTHYPSVSTTAPPSLNASTNFSRVKPTPEVPNATTQSSNKSRQSSFNENNSYYEGPYEEEEVIEEEEEEVEDTAEIEPNTIEHTSAERQSWGNYITNSLWGSGRLSASNVSLRDESSPHDDLAEQLIDDIAQHIILQVSRIIEERVINVAVHTVSMVAIHNTKNNVNDALREENLLAGRRYRLSASFEDTALPVPFETEKAWFQAIDDGVIVDKDDLTVNASLNIGKINKHLCSVRVLEREALQVGTVEPMYDTLDGCSQRKDDLIAPDPHFAIIKHWWPYLYEVLIHQWATVLSIVSGQNVEGLSDGYPCDILADTVLLRNLVMEHGATLLKMIHKSLSFRIYREGKRPPVLLDNETFEALNCIVTLIGTEACTVQSGVWRSRRMVTALAKFINSLFALLAPKQVLMLIRSYFKSIRSSKSVVEESEQRLLFLQEISYFDHIVAVNFPYTLDAPISLFFNNIEDMDSIPNESLSLSYTFTGIRFSNCPAPFTLAYTMIHEVLACYRQDSNKRITALDILRDMMVRHAFDARYQRKGKQQRVACMYIPLVHEFLKESDRLWSLKFDSTERKEMLVMMTYVLAGVPDRILRAMIRQFCSASETLQSEKQSRKSLMATVSYGDIFADDVNARVMTLKRESVVCTPEIEAFIPKSTLRGVLVYELLALLHLLLDTFENPYVPMPSPGGKDYVSLCNDMLSPKIVFDSNANGVVTSAAAPTDSPLGIISPVTSATSIIARRGSGQAVENKSGDALSKLANLDDRLQRKAAGVSRKSIAPVGGKNEERRWAEHVRKMGKEGSRTHRVAMKGVNKSVVTSAANHLAVMTTKTVLNTLWVMLEECPSLLDSLDPNDIFGLTGSFVLRDCNIDESVLAGISNLRAVPFVRMALCVLLHGLYCNQAADMVIEFFLSAVSVIRKFGAKIFLIAAEDSLQYWLRAAIFFCGFNDANIQGAACDFLLCIMRACFHYFGSFTLISTTILAVFNDCLWEILDYNRHRIKTYNDEDTVLKRLSEAIENMRQVAREKLSSKDENGLLNRSPFCSALVSFLNGLDTIMLANGDFRRYVTHPVDYDYFGANLLDGPFETRTITLVQASRTRRRLVTGEVNGAASKAGFHIEEVMARFVAASEVYDPFKLPRFRMFWLENLARLHELCGNRAEGAEIRWRIFVLAYQLQENWTKMWAPRPPLPWVRRGIVATPNDYSIIANNIDLNAPTGVGGSRVLDGDRNFYRVLMKALDAKTVHPWTDNQQYTTHMITTLTVATERFCSMNLIHLAERASGHAINLYRMGRRNNLMEAEYTRLVNGLKATAEKGITTSIAMGTFYRVYYDGKGVPPYLRGKEFIFRNASHLHVSEFQALVANHLKAIVAEGTEVKMIQDSNAPSDMQDSPIAYLIMNSVKLIMSKGNIGSLSSAIANKYISMSYGANAPRLAAAPKEYYGGSGMLPSHNSNVQSLNQVAIFQYSSPFTQDGSRSHAKKIDDQWIRTTILTVKEPFPYVLTRQLVISRETRIYCPIEASTIDIEDRIEAMEIELSIETKSQSDINNLMRIVQGTVLPQVNAGAAEVAKIFLSPSRVYSEQMQAKLKVEAAHDIDDDQSRRTALVEATTELEKTRARVIKLKVALLNFLLCSKQLLLKTRRVLITDTTLLEPSSLLSDSPVDRNSNGGGGGVSGLPPPSVGGSPVHHQPQPSPQPAPPTPSTPSTTRSKFSALFSVATGKGGAVRRSTFEAVALTVANVHANNANLSGQAGANSNSNGNNANGNANANGTLSGNYTPQELTNIKWQNEMERGFDALVQAIYPYIAELREADVFSPNRFT